MKAFFGKANRSLSMPRVPAPLQNLPGKVEKLAASVTGGVKAGVERATMVHMPGLPPKDILPPVPHPSPYHHLALLATREGLVVRSHIPGSSNPHNATTDIVRIAWSKTVMIEPVTETEGDKLNWPDAVIVYGIVGILELYNYSYLLVITSRSEVGSFIDPANTIYAIKHVVDIPLVEERARNAINLLKARQRPPATTRPSLLAPVAAPAATAIPPQAGSRVQFQESETSTPAPSQYLSVPTNAQIGQSITRPGSAQSNDSASDLSASVTAANSPVFETLVGRLSFWGKKSGGASLPGPNVLPGVDGKHSANSEDVQVLDGLIKETSTNPEEVMQSILTNAAPAPATTEAKHAELETKIVREVIREYSKGGMYFAYSFDITRSLQHKREIVLKSLKTHDLLSGLGALPSPEAQGSASKESDTSSLHQRQEIIDPNIVPPLLEPHLALPLWRRVDKKFWWNEALSKQFIDAGFHSFVLPIMQGYCQVSRFNIPPDGLGVYATPLTPGTVEHPDVEVDYIIISRRSRHRPGLRYQRRGIDDEAHVANFVETESIVSVEREGRKNVFSYVQVRGSIPLFWTQTGYGLKPPPVLSTDRTKEQNEEAMRKHLATLAAAYGPLTAVNLAEQQGREGAITTAFKEGMESVGMKDAQYCEYDFHAETKGMKYENISRLIEQMERVFDAQGFFWSSNDTLLAEQKGAFRVNCIDCLDRTNVVQSAFARFVLNKQLRAVALENPTIADKGVQREEAEWVFNDTWANNGDMISRAYAGTSALKGDFTRTGKRDLTGMLNDGVNSLARMYSSTFSDWFSQAVIDFMLGNRTLSVFSEFLHNLKSTDPRDLLRLEKIRAEAIETAKARVIEDDKEICTEGWTFMAPVRIGERLGGAFEEKVLLLTNRALYIVSYDYTLQKVMMFTKVLLGNVLSISKGAYILSPLEESSRDPEQNAGFMVTWMNSSRESRVSSYSMRNTMTLKTTGIPLAGVVAGLTSTLKRGGVLANVFASASGAGEFAAFKALPGEEMTCRERVDDVAEKIRLACHLDDVREADVVGVDEARQQTSVYAKMEYGLKRLLWLGG